MNICLYSNTIELPGGGTSTRITIDYLRKHGHKVTLFTDTEELKKSLAILAQRNSLPDIVLHHNIINLEKVSKIASKYSVPLIVTINNLITDVNGLHIEQDDDFGKVILKPGIFKSFYLSLTQKRIHTKKNKLLSIIFFIYRHLRKKKRLEVLRKAAGVIVTSSTLKKLLILHGVKRHIYVCPQPIDDSMLSNPGYKGYKSSKYINPYYKHHILYVGGGEPFKGIHLLIKAFDALKRNDTELIIAGEIRKAHKINIYDYPKNIRFIGQVSDKELKALYYSVDFLAFPSLWLEAFGRAWAEAACCACPTLAFKGRAGPYDYLKHNVNAYFADANYPSFIRAIKILLDDKSLRIKLGKNAKKFARNNLIASVAIRKLEKIYKEVLANDG
ncbi:glycosyltransferase family 4 protein [Candidatus Woesearchaeota archaeon]|nr:glycosyltransferase family 4 protein [Candidatus Woesearchaeota archaeon]